MSEDPTAALFSDKDDCVLDNDGTFSFEGHNQLGNIHIFVIGLSSGNCHRSVPLAIGQSSVLVDRRGRVKC